MFEDIDLECDEEGLSTILFEIRNKKTRLLFQKVVRT